MPCVGPKFQTLEEYDKEASIILALLSETYSGKLPKWYGDYYDEEVKAVVDECHYTHSRLDEFTDSLCKKLRDFGGEKALYGYSKELQEWWKKHRDFDIYQREIHLANMKADVKNTEENLKKTRNEIDKIQKELDILRLL